MLLPACDGNYVYRVKNKGEGDDAHKSWERRHCKDGYTYQLVQNVWNLPDMYGQPVKDITYRIFRYPEEFKIENIYREDFGHGDWGRTANYYYNDTLEMYCNACFDTVTPALCDKITLHYRMLNFWFVIYFDTYEECITEFNRRLPDVPSDIYLPGDCHDWWDHGSATCNY